MFKRLVIPVLLIAVAFSCNKSASSRFEVVSLEDDNIADLEKIRIFEDNADILSGPAYAAIANLYAREKDYRAAFDAVHEAIVQEPMNSFYHTLKSNYAYELGDISTAYREALTAYQLGSKSLQESLILARMGVALSEYSIVNDIIDSLVIIYPNDPEVVYMAARKFEKSGQTSQAIEQYQKGITLDRERSDNYYHLARVYLDQQNEDRALKLLEDFMLPEIEPRLALLKADVFEKLEEFDSAALYYNFLIAEKKDSVIYGKLINMYRQNNMNRELTEFSALSADSFPESRYFVSNAGKVLNDRYKFDQALVYYKRLFELDTLDTLVAQEISILQRKIAYLQRKREVERMNNSIPIQGITLPSLDSIKKD